MKLWKKISLICGSVLIVIVTICSAILLGQTQRKILSLTYEQAAEKQKTLAFSFTETANHFYEEDDSEAVAYALLHYCFSRIADSSAVLRVGEETVYSQIGIRPEEYLLPEEFQGQQQYSGKIDGRHILIVGSTENLLGSPDKPCEIYIVEDITPVYENLTKVLWQFILIGAACIMVGLLFIIILVRRSLRPLAMLQASASHIAAGNYHERTKVCSGDEVGMLASDFNRMTEAVEKHINELTDKNKRQELFIGGVTHEFKTPLTALLLNIDTLQNTYMEEEERSLFLEHMERQCKWLERLVQKLLKLITLGQKLDLKRTAVSELLEKVQESVAENLRAREVILEVHCKTEMLTLDADLMQSVLVNLVDNAIKASAKGQTVVLAAYDNVLEVRDQGIGIEQEELAHITEPFYMVDKSRSKKQGGVGLGLALVKEIVKAHGALLEMESSPGIGTTVRIHFTGQ
ncbi:MAG: HAMP domain-containing histidine kinase [Lachnospiraceae bacterium]|nr:HAMP domain-containing histidine kinase [Lachnospiraceae bacterium]